MICHFLLQFRHLLQLSAIGHAHACQYTSLSICSTERHAALCIALGVSEISGWNRDDCWLRARQRHQISGSACLQAALALSFKLQNYVNFLIFPQNDYAKFRYGLFYQAMAKDFGPI